MLHPAWFISHGAGVDFRPDEPPIVAAELQLEPFHNTRSIDGGQPFAPLVGGGAKALGIDCAQGLAIRVTQHPDHGRVGVSDPAIQRHAEQPCRDPVKQISIARLGLLQRPALPGPIQCQHRRRGKARVVSGRFEDVIIQAGLHCPHSDLFIARTGEHDHSTVWPPGFDRLQNAEAIAPPQTVVRNHQVPRTAFEGPRELFEVGHLVVLAIRKFPVQLPNGQRPIIRVVVHQKDIQNPVHDEPFCQMLVIRADCLSHGV